MKFANKSSPQCSRVSCQLADVLQNPKWNSSAYTTRPLPQDVYVRPVSRLFCLVQHGWPSCASSRPHNFVSVGYLGLDIHLRSFVAVSYSCTGSFVWWGETVRVVCADGYYDFDHPAQDALELVCDYTELQNISEAQLDAVTCSPMCVSHLLHSFAITHGHACALCRRPLCCRSVCSSGSCCCSVYSSLNQATCFCLSV